MGSKGNTLGRLLWRRNIRFKSKIPLRKQSCELFANKTTNVLVRGVETPPPYNRLPQTDSTGAFSHKNFGVPKPDTPRLYYSISPRN
jgi:hypothetical protein